MASERRLRAYYYAFSETGRDSVDAVLESVAFAGKAYHHTDGWSEGSGYVEGISHVGLIQQRAQALADELAALTAAKEAAEAEAKRLRADAGRLDWIITASNEARIDWLSDSFWDALEDGDDVLAAARATIDAAMSKPPTLYDGEAG